MGPLSRWAVFNPKKAVAIWVLAMVGLFVTAGVVGNNYNESFTLPDTESKQVQELLASEFGNAGNDDVTAKVVFSPAEGKVTAPEVKEQVAEILAELEQNPSVTNVVSPFDAPAGQGGGEAPAGDDATASSPAGTAGAFMSPISADETVAYATFEFKVNAERVAPLADINKAVEVIEAADSPELRVGAAGSPLEFAGGEAPTSELIGIGVALVVLLLMFGSVVAAGLPILTAVIGMATGFAMVTIATQIFDTIPSFITILGAMIGLGVGIDYSLFVINRFKTAVDAGRDVRTAAIEAVNTSGRAVLFAACTVMIALAGLFVLGISFLNGLGIGSILVVFCVMLSALWLLPALLSWMGPKAFAWKLPWRREVKHFPKGTPMARYGHWLQRRPWVGLIALGLVVLIALPTLSLRSGFADAGGRAEGQPMRIGYDLLSEGFGPGINGPFIIAVDTPGTGDTDGAQAVATALQEAPGVAGASNPFPNTEDPADATAFLITVYPEYSPQSEETDTLLQSIRDDVIPQAVAGSDVRAYVGGAKASAVDFGKVLSDALPLFLAVVIGFGFIALCILFRSIVVPLTAAITSLLSFAAGMGTAVAVFQWGWGAELVGIDSTGPIVPFLPVMLFAILFGLSMDYQVFLVSRMQEEWTHTKDNRRSVRRGLAGSGRVVVAAALIMSSVFYAFVLAPDPIGKLFGIALGTAVLVDAFLVRLVVVPALMTVLGSANWWLPGFLDRLLPHLEVEQSEAEFEAEDALIEDVPDADTDDDLTPAGSR
jgi:putative drug exporter of the RND superfamily